MRWLPTSMPRWEKWAGYERTESPQIMGMIRRLADTLGLAVLLVEQNARSALSIASRGVVLNLGRVVAEQEPQKLIADDKLLHAYLGF